MLINKINNIDFNKKTGFICDMDGVIYHGNQILPGVVLNRVGDIVTMAHLM